MKVPPVIACVGVCCLLLVSCRQEGGGGAGTEAGGEALPHPPNDSALAGEQGLVRSVLAGDVERVRWLLIKGADPNEENRAGVPVLALAAEAGYREVVALLAPYCSESWDEALFLAACGNHDEIAELLIRHGASVHARTGQGMTPLMAAASHGAADAVHVLMEGGSNRYATNANEHTAGQLAMMAGHIDLGRLLLRAPAEEEFSLDDPEEDSGRTVATGPGHGEGRLAATFEPSRVSDAVAKRISKGGGSESEWINDRIPEPVAADQSRWDLPALPFEIREFHQRWLPFMIRKVAGEKIELRFLFGENARMVVRRGDTIPGTRLKIVALEESAIDGEALVVVEDPRTSRRRMLRVGREAVSGDPYAVLEAEGARMIARPGEIVQTGAGNRYRVIDVHPTKVVFQNARTGSLAAVTLRR